MDKNSNNLDEMELKRRIANLEKKVGDNQKLRIKYADDPAKFAASETELFAALDELQGVTTQTELYRTLIEKNTLKTLISLIPHENTDISGKVIVIVQELTDIEGAIGLDVVDDLVYGLHDENLFHELLNNFKRLNFKNKEEAQIINNSLGIVENMVDYEPDFAGKSYLDGGFGDWMLNHIETAPKEFNYIKLAIGEMLSICVRQSGYVTSEFGEKGGFSIVLQQIFYYHERAPKTGEEHEYLEQLISCICLALTDCDVNRAAFYNEYGVIYIGFALNEKNANIKKSNIKFGILKIFNTLLSTSNNRDPTVSACCELFIKDLGLRVIFPIFNNPKVVLNERIKKKEYRQFIDEVEEHTCGILLALMKYCQNPEYTQRMLVKFSELDFEKLNRLIELHDKYFKLVTTNRDEFEAKNPEPTTDWYDGDDNKYRMLFILRAVDYMILLCCYLGNKFETYDPNSGETFTSRISKILNGRPELKHQIVIEAGQHSEEVQEAKEEQNSLAFLLEHFKTINSKKTIDSV